MKQLLLTTIAAVVLVGCVSIHDAAEKGNIEAVKQHIAAGTDVNVKNKYERTPLIQAAYRGHKEIAELLIEKGADVNAKDHNGETPLDVAIGRKHPETADLLRKNGGKTGKELSMMPRLVQHGRFAFSFGAKEGMVYEVQSSQDLRSWGTLKTYNGTGTLIRFEDERDQVFPQIYYRVRVAE